MRSSSRSAVDPFIVMDVLADATRAEAEGRHIIHMEVGQPGVGAPAAARQAVARALEEGPLGYTVTPGLMPLRNRIAQLYQTWYGVDLNPERVIVTSGSSGAFLLAFTLLFDNAARVAVPSPGYPSYRQILTALGMIPVDIQTRAEARFQPTPADLPDGIDGLMVASPANPSGTVLDRAALTDLIGAAQTAGAAFISDEIYHGLHYGRAPVTALEISDDVIVINSFSKYFAMTGWRVGWMVVPETHIRTVDMLAQNMFICAPHVGQVAALAALEATDELEANRAVYAANREILLDALPKAGFDKIAPPDGAFYVYVDVSDLTQDSRAFAAEILAKVDVAVTPGLDFDPVRGHQTIRLSYARSTEHVAEGMRRLARFMADRA